MIDEPGGCFLSFAGGEEICLIRNANACLSCSRGCESWELIFWEVYGLFKERKRGKILL